MNPAEVLATFLLRVLSRKSERYSSFARSTKHRQKILDSLHHEIGALFDQSRIVSSIPAAAWESPALCYRPPNTFGVPYGSLKIAHNEPHMSVLVVTTDGTYGYYREETLIDSEVLFDLSEVRLRPATLHDGLARKP